MSSTTSPTQEFIASVYPFNQLPEQALAKLAETVKPVRFLIGETLILRERIPSHLMILYRGQARLLGYDPRKQKQITLQKLEPRAIIGWTGLIREVYSETAIASTEVECLVLPAKDFLALLHKYTQLSEGFQKLCSTVEIFDVLAAELERKADGTSNLKDLTLKASADAVVVHFPPVSAAKLDSDRLWFVSSGSAVSDFPVGSRLDSEDSLKQLGSSSVRLVGLSKGVFEQEDGSRERREDAETGGRGDEERREEEGSRREEIPHASEYLPSIQELANAKQKNSNRNYPFVQGKGSIKETLACFNMLSRYFNTPFHQEVLRRVITNQHQGGGLSLGFCAAIADMMGLQGQLMTIQAATLPQIPTPILVRWENSFAIIYEIKNKKVTLALPQVGIRKQKLSTFIDLWGQTGQVLVVNAGAQTPQKRFGLSWFIPALLRYRRVLFEVLVASFCVQLFSLANPLMTQTIIDKVIIGNSIDTLHVFGILMLVLAAFEGLLSSLRTYLFSNTTSRIDLTLGSMVIDHLLRLPMGYFGKRTVGELATRVQELEKIRSFLTGTALTVVLDIVFSFIYIGVMFFYSPTLTLASLSVLPLFVILTVVFSPILRRMLRTKAERHAEGHSYLVELLNGIETVKSQTIELRSRMSWQERYAHYVSSGFKAVKLGTTLSSLSDFLNKTSSLLVLWVGAYLVLQQELTLGEMIAFRIIAGYVTTPLLRLSQLWQNFQETALSIERLGDILNHTLESPPEARKNLPMPTLKGAVQYENLSFRFAQSGPLQLNQINLEVPAGSFIALVGQSGSGKSTLTKLLPRFYEPLGGRILVDGYDISKVELYSLRRQMGIVPQSPLLFEGTIYENIALNNPEASTEEIIEAAKIADAHEFIENLPNGYNTQVGERGSSLSGGQRQRIAIARTVLQNPQMLILDEATSALDYETEKRVCHNLMEAFEGRTVFFITHRLSSVKGADKIVLMANGAIAETGTHEELMSLKGRYYCLYN
jgi:HlyB family type I secretion system ABC transporter